MSKRELSLIQKHSLTLSYSDFCRLIIRANTTFYRASGDVSEALFMEQVKGIAIFNASDCKAFMAPVQDFSNFL